MTTDQIAQDEIKRWGGEFIAVLDAIRENEPEDVIRVRLLGEPDQAPAALNYRLWMMLPVGAWVAGQLLERNHPAAAGTGFFGPEMPESASPAERCAAQLMSAAANHDDEQVLALARAQHGAHGWLGVGEALAALATSAAPFWDRKPVDL